MTDTPEVNWPEPADDPEIEPTHGAPTPYDQDDDPDVEPDSEGGEAG